MAIKSTVKRGGGRRVVDSETPSGSIIADANALIPVTLPNGSSIMLRRMNAFREMQLSQIFGSETPNQMLYGWCVLAASVAEIDGDVLPMPATTLECQAIIARIGDDGVTAIQKAVIPGA